MEENKKDSNFEISEKLQIFVPTYNRAQLLKRTLDSFLSSPVRDCEITVLDNHSSDETESIMNEYSQKYSNIKYKRNRYNISADVNIVNAYYSAEKEYFWVCGDDDIFYWENWNEVETAMKNGEKAIIIGRSELREDLKDRAAEQLYQATFISSVIINNSILNDNILTSMYKSTVYLLEQLVPLISLINKNGKIYVVDKPVVIAGHHVNQGAKDTSYVRGNERTELFYRINTMSWLVGYCYILSYLKDRKIAAESLKYATTTKYGGNHSFVTTFKCRNMKDLMHCTDIFVNVPLPFKMMIIGKILEGILTNFCHNFFCIYKTEKHRCFNILGLKLRIKRKHIKIRLFK